MGLIPDLEGIYRDDLLEMAGKKAAAPAFDAVFVSHAHADHVDYISFLPAKSRSTLGLRAIPF
ncbi:MAG: hypothetical protein E6K85_09995 [Thaumarchaeota archaeon]|nr:MAG: hypothetical protein E6K85_09995 [Nitrososphaerota archaeon]